MFTISIESASFFFFTDNEKQYPEGPHFTIFFYVTIIGITASLCGAIGVIIYNRFMNNWKYRTIFICNNLLYMIVSLSNVIIYKRWNIAWGISDKVFILGAESFQHVIGIWTYIPFSIMISQLCIPGMEALVFGLLASSSNLGSALSQFQGAFMLELLGITPNGSLNESDKFNNLWMVSLISSITPCIPLILVYFLIPDSSQNEPLNMEEGEQNESTSSDSESSYSTLCSYSNLNLLYKLRSK
jgi:Na+/melibiose symporter-like transporter